MKNQTSRQISSNQVIAPNNSDKTMKEPPPKVSHLEMQYEHQVVESANF
jgi:hypothetical protein